MCKDCQCSNIQCNGALVAKLDSFVRERKIDVSVSRASAIDMAGDDGSSCIHDHVYNDDVYRMVI